MYFNKRYRLIISIIKTISELIDFRKKFKKIDLKLIHSVLIVDFQQIGDIVVSSGFIRDLKNQHPHLEISIVGLPFLKDILADDDNLSNVINIKGGWFERFNSVRKIGAQYDLVICPRGDVRDILMGRMLSKKYVLSFDFSGGDFLLDAVADAGEMSHISHRQIQLGKYLGLYDDDVKYSYFLPVKTSLEKKKVDEIAIHIGSSRRLRQLPELELFKIIEDLLSRGKKVTFFEAPGLAEGMSERLLQMFGVNDFKIWKGSLSNFIVELSKFQILITTDSAQAHLASGWGLNTLVIFGPSKMEFCHPIGDKVLNIKKKDVACSPCTQYKCLNKEYQYCYKDIHSLVIKELDGVL